jgi:hypothetical protein
MESPGSGILCYGDPDYYNPFAVNLLDEFLENFFRMGEQ